MLCDSIIYISMFYNLCFDTRARLTIGQRTRNDKLFVPFCVRHTMFVSSSFFSYDTSLINNFYKTCIFALN
jgi:hypothetical protein